MLGFIKRIFSDSERWEKLEKGIATAFERVRSDTSNIFSWVNYLKEKDESNDEKHQQINYILGTHNAIIKHLQQQIIELKNQKNTRTGSETDLVRTKSEPKTSGAKVKFERNVIRKVMSKRKEYVMEQILMLVNKGKHSTSEIEDIVVNDKVLCGRTAFYDYLRELRYKKIIRMEKTSGKPMVVLA